MDELPWIFKRRSFQTPQGEQLGMISMQVKAGEGIEICPVVEATTFLVDWGDGCSDYSQCHCYEQEGVYRVRIVGSAIHALDVSKCRLTDLQIGKCPGLQHLNCAHNFMTHLEIGSSSALVTLDCSDNALTALELTDAGSLFSLDCSRNYLTRLKLERCEQLYYLYCADNELSDISLDGCTNLSCVDIGYNHLDAAALNRFFALLPDRPKAAILLEQENLGCGKACDPELLRRKGWIIV